MFSLINVTGIVKKHYGTLSSDSKLRFIVIIFFLVPALCAFILVDIERFLTQNSVNALITAYAIFTALLLNVIFIIYDIMGKLKVNNNPTDPILAEIKEHDQKELLEHLYYNSLYSLVTAIVILIFLIVTVLIEVWNIQGSVLLVSSFLIYFMVAHFLMNLLMITKRLSALLSSKLDT